MSETNHSSRLEEVRFPLTHGSLQHMVAMRAELKKLQQDYPQVQGLSFFGSRTAGRENKNGKISDLDTCVFYDGTEFSPDKELSMPLTEERGRLAFKRLQDRDQFISNIINRITKKMNDLGLPIDDAINQSSNDAHVRLMRALGAKVKINRSIGAIDISLTATDKTLGAFMLEMDSQPDNDFLSKLNSNNFDLVSRFFLGTGDGLYRNRKYILDKLSADPKGEFYFQKLMQCLQAVERLIKTNKRDSLLAYKHLPKSIAEARTYFFLPT